MSSMQAAIRNEKKPSIDLDGFFFAPMSPAFLVLENGTVFSGLSPNWQEVDFDGEVVFTTGMTGYEASLTDPSYAGQILAFTYPLIGNYGVPDKSLWESERIYAAGVVVSSCCEKWSHGKSLDSLLQWLQVQNIPVITGVDTRRLTRTLREAGTMMGTISRSDVPRSDFVDLSTPDLASRVSIKDRVTYGAKGKRIIAVDCGMKTNIIRCLLEEPVIIDRVSYDYDYSDDEFDGIFLSNGPGDPKMYAESVSILQKAMKRQKPIFGICLGAQLLALAGGATTYKMKYGHRGHNQPCIDTGTNRCYITSQNHGYAVNEDSLPDQWKVSFRNLNDGTVEGIAHASLPFSAVQFHPEAAPGPTDTQWLFKDFYSKL